MIGSAGRLALLQALTIVGLVAAAASARPAIAQGDDEATGLAQQLSNPVAALISVPLQFNYDQGFGTEDGEVWRLNVQPVVPINLNDDWNLISRTIVPIAYQDDIFAGAGSQFGIGDTLQSLFLSPQAPTAGGWVWGAGPVLLLPTATDELLGGEQWAAGPTAVVLRQSGGWTYGALANHLWSFAGDDDRADIDATYVQPFLSYTTPDAWTFGLNTESTYDWTSEQWSVPLNATVSKLFRVGTQPVSVGAGIRYWADSPDGGPEGLGARLVLTLLYPR